MTQLNSDIVRSLIKATDGVNQPQVYVCRNTFRAAMFELLRLIETQSDIDYKKSRLIQQLTFEFACQHIADRLIDLERDAPPGATAQQVLLYAHSQILNLKFDNMAQTEGKA